MKTVRFFIVALLMILAPALVSAQTQSVSQTVDVNLTVTAAMALNVTQSLDFGSTFQGASNVTINPITGGSNAGFATLTSAPGSQSLTVSWTNTSLTNGSTTISWTPSVAGSATNTQTGATDLTNDGSVTASSSGSYYIWVGGTIPSVPSAASTGAYTGTLTLTVAY